METFAFPALDESHRVSMGGGSVAEHAAAIVAQAEADAAAIVAAAVEQGRSTGYDAGLAEAREQLGPAREALQAAAQQLAAVQEEFCAAAERAAVELALALAEKVIGSTLVSRPELVLEVVTGALRRTVERDHLVVLVNPEDLALVRSSVEDLAVTLGGIGRLEVASERRVQRGGCIVRTTEGEVDGRISEQLDRAAEVLYEAAARDE